MIVHTFIRVATNRKLWRLHRAEIDAVVILAGQAPRAKPLRVELPASRLLKHVRVGTSHDLGVWARRKLEGLRLRRVEGRKVGVGGGGRQQIGGCCVVRREGRRPIIHVGVRCTVYTPRLLKGSLGACLVTRVFSFVAEIFVI